MDIDVAGEAVGRLWFEVRQSHLPWCFYAFTFQSVLWNPTWFKIKYKSLLHNWMWLHCFSSPQLFSDVCPKTSKNFEALCTGEEGLSESGLPLHYKRSLFHRIVPNGWVQGGGNFGDILSFKTFINNQYVDNRNTNFVRLLTSIIEIHFKAVIYLTNMSA